MNGQLNGGSAVAGDSAAIAAWTLASRVTGLGKVVAIAAVLGPTYLGNTFQAMNLVPNLAYEFLTGTLFANLLVPSLVGHLRSDDPRGVEQLAGRFMGLSMAAFAGLAAVVTLAGPLLLRVFTAGVSDPTVAAAQRHAGWLLLALLIPQVVFYGIAGTAAAVLNAHGRFGLVAAAPVLENLGLVATMAAVAMVFGTGGDVTDVSSAQLLLLGMGSTGAVVVHAGLLWWGARRRGVVLLPRRGWADPELRELLRRAVPSLGHAGLNSLRTLVVLVLANRVRGGVVAFQLALNFFHLPVALGAKAIGVAMLPRLARLDHEDRLAAFRDQFVRGTSMMLFLTVPAAVAYLVLARPLAAAVSWGEMARPGAATLVAAALAGLAAGILGEALFIVATHAAYARRDARSPFRAMLVRTVVSLALMAGVTLVTDEALFLVGLALALTIGNLLSAGQLWLGVRWSLPAGEESLGPDLRKTMAAALAMAGPAYLVATYVPRPGEGTAGDLLAMASAVVVGGVIFLAAQRAMNSQDLRAFLDARPGTAVRHTAGAVDEPDLASDGPAPGATVLQQGEGRLVVAEAGGRTVRKSFTAGPASRDRQLARQEFDHLLLLSDALAGVGGVSCPRPLAWGDEPLPHVRMTRAPGVPLDVHLRHERLAAEDRDRIATMLRKALGIYVTTFSEPYFDLHFRNMIIDPASGSMTLLDFDVPIQFRDASLQGLTHLEVSLGNLVGSCCFEAARPSRLLSWRQRRQSIALCAAVVLAFDPSDGGADEVSDPRIRGIGEAAAISFTGSAAHGRWYRLVWYRTIGRLMKARVARGLRAAGAEIRVPPKRPT